MILKGLKPFKLNGIQASWRSIPDRVKFWAAVRAFAAKFKILGQIMQELQSKLFVGSSSNLMATSRT